jgi:cysteine synthase A
LDFKLPSYQIAELQNPLIDAAPSRSLLWSVPSTTLSSRLRVSDEISKLVGETPMLQMKKLAPSGSADIFAKLEYLNPGGSVKDRAAIGLIERAESEGKLKRGGTVIEATAGNTGIGLALIGVSRGYKVRLFVPEKFSEEKVIIMRAFGAEVTRTPEAEGMQGAIQRAKDLQASEPGAFLAAQFDNPRQYRLPL